MLLGPNQGGQRYEFFILKIFFPQLVVLHQRSRIRTQNNFYTYKSPFSLTFTLNMDNKVTLSFNKDVIRRAKEFAASHKISLSRLVELLLLRTTMEQYSSLEDIPIASWVKELSQGNIEYTVRKRSRKDSKDEFFSSKK